MTVVIPCPSFTMPFQNKLSLLLAFLLLLIKCQFLNASNNFVPDAPVINFKLPMFNNDGYRTWFLTGEQGIYVSQDEVDVLGMKITIFSGDPHDLLEATIESPKAIMFIKQNRANSDDSIEVQGPSYHLTGKVWTWDGNLKKMSINKDVKVTFDQSLKGLISYEKK